MLTQMNLKLASSRLSGRLDLGIEENEWLSKLWIPRHMKVRSGINWGDPLPSPSCLRKSSPSPFKGALESEASSLSCGWKEGTFPLYTAGLRCRHAKQCGDTPKDPYPKFSITSSHHLPEILTRSSLLWTFRSSCQKQKSYPDTI